LSEQINEELIRAFSHIGQKSKYSICWKTLEERDYLEDLSIDRKKLKWMLEKQDVWV